MMESGLLQEIVTQLHNELFSQFIDAVDVDATLAAIRAGHRARALADVVQLIELKAREVGGA